MPNDREEKIEGTAHEGNNAAGNTDQHLLPFRWSPDFGLNIAVEMRSSSRQSLIIFLEAANHQRAFKRGDDQICDFTLVHAGPRLSCFDALSDDRLEPLLPALERLACMITKHRIPVIRIHSRI